MAVLTTNACARSFEHPPYYQMGIYLAMLLVRVHPAHHHTRPASRFAFLYHAAAAAQRRSVQTARKRHWFLEFVKTLPPPVLLLFELFGQ